MEGGIKGLANMKVVELPRKLTCSWMRGEGIFARMGVQGDGSCFFHSVCALTNRNNYLFETPSKQKDIAYEFRCDFASKFTKDQYKELSKKSGSRKSHESYSDGFCSPKVWADETMIRYASRVLDINLIFLDLENDSAYCGVHGEKADEDLTAGNDVMQTTGIIAWVSKQHFEPIVRVDDALKGEITTLFEPGKNNQDKKLISEFMKTYSDSCNL
jgi:hypothetical protein